LTKSEYVARHLREAIIAGERPAGTRIRQQQVAAALNVSPTPVREAIRRLEAEGYVESAPHTGARVTEVRDNDLEEVYRLRALLEGELAAEAARRATPAQLRRLDELAADFAATVTRSDTVAARRVNYRLHRLVWEIASRPVTLCVVDSLWAKFPQVLGSDPDRGDRSAGEHRRLLRALAAHDADEAGAAARAHVRSGREEVLRPPDPERSAPSGEARAARRPPADPAQR
jgi:DNA-binding GntR family transcriptional regulator